MPEKIKADGYKEFSKSLKSGQIGNFCIFHGEERFLLEYCLGDLRSLLCPDGMESFNYKRFEGKELSNDELEAAIDTLPAFAERTLIEVHDFDIFKGGEDEKRERLRILSSLPEYVCVLFIYDLVPYKPDGRTKINAEIIKHANVYEFVIQSRDDLVNWIGRHFADAGKRISVTDAEHLTFITGNLMSPLLGEIEKIAAYAKGAEVTRSDIDAVVTPVLDAVVYNLTNALAGRDHAGAMRILDELLRMQEAPHKIFFSISLNLRQLLAARICIENRLDRNALMEICGIRKDYPARLLMDAARKMTLSECRDAVQNCSVTALELNSSSEPEARLTELITKLAFRHRERAL